MKLVIITLVFITTLFPLSSLGQESDSTIYKMYHHLDNVDSVFYLKHYYDNGVLEHEGWVIFETLRNNNNIQNILVPEGAETPIEMNIGRHIYYYKNGAIKLDAQLNNEFKKERIEKGYNKKGELEYLKKSKEKDTIPYKFIFIGKKDEKIKEYSNLSYRKEEYYFKGKIWFNEEFLSDDTRCGCWRTYKKNGKIKSEKYYEKGVLISKKCPEK